MKKNTQFRNYKMVALTIAWLLTWPANLLANSTQENGVLLSKKVSKSLSFERNANGLSTEASLHSGYAISADSRYVVLTRTSSSDQFSNELVSIPIGGGPAITLGDGVQLFKITPDGTSVVFLGRENGQGALAIFVIPITGGKLKKLIDNIYFSDVDFKIARNNRYIVVRTPIHTPNGKESRTPLSLFSVALDNAKLTKLTTKKDYIISEHIDAYQISPDSGRVVYRANRVNAKANGLFSVSIKGGKARKISGPDVADSGVARHIKNKSKGFGFAISPDSRNVVYAVYEPKTGRLRKYGLYSTPIMGGKRTQLTIPFIGRLAKGISNKLTWRIMPDGQSVLYEEQVYGQEASVWIYNVPIVGGESKIINIDKATQATFPVREYWLQPNGRDLIFESKTHYFKTSTATNSAIVLTSRAECSKFIGGADNKAYFEHDGCEDTATLFQSVDLNDLSKTKLNTEFLPKTKLSSNGRTTSDNQQYVFIYKHGDGEQPEIYAATLNEGQPHKLTSQYVDNRRIQNFLISNDSRYLVYEVENFNSRRREIFSRKLSSP